MPTPSLLFILTSLIAFVASVLISVMVARWLYATYKSKLVALCGTAVAGIALSIISDFTLAYSIDEYDRSFQMVIERAVMSAVISAIIGYFAIQSSVAMAQPKRRRWVRSLVLFIAVGFALYLIIYSVGSVLTEKQVDWVRGFLPATLIIPFVFYAFVQHEVAEWSWERRHGLQGSSASFGLLVDATATITSFALYILLIAYVFDYGWQQAVGLYLLTIFIGLGDQFVPILIKRAGETTFLLFRLLCLGTLYVVFIYLCIHVSWFGAWKSYS